MKRICENCKFYEKENEDHGRCNSEKFVYLRGGNFNKDKKRVLNDKLGYWDDEDYDANFEVGKNFGCIHFQKKEI